ncbi:helix-turn-helix domain-containing protein [Paenibacillus sp. SN-8-1]|uniref:helix-turn-helix domain-containing protein n=1 Tax=Paenibacillus sp. SN-8-1 TaxID=3435409 RepID=UPI003D9A3520
MQVIYKWIKKKRLEKGWTQMELAERSGVPQPTICQIEIGNRKYPTHDTIIKIATALRADTSELDDETTLIKEDD